ncbi:MAG: ribose 5-phosphate isomerase B [Candidatus Omnitrophica bacterium]|nr:ribose 5-phosphate isomerase B [Candidatus Omnitrophota bacterium]MDD5080536.1 ribose 5-phosphate isomerase B [Candidatus Omnitrophota bacterium]MDD5441376.1 ribose 5-phosphate isomerase B [Candidatus Omnitrophota bacterium]
MKIALASDHRGVRLKKFVAQYLKELGHETEDFGTYSKDSCDYPDYVYPASKSVQEKKNDRAIVICYTGIGSSIVANKVNGIRASLVFNLASAKLTRQHNDSNVLVLAAPLFKRDYLKKVISIWLKTEFEGGRHLRRVKKIREIENKEK